MNPRLAAAALALLCACSAPARAPAPAEPVSAPALADEGAPPPAHRVARSERPRVPRVDEANLTSPFASDVRGLDIPNTHLVARAEGEVLRGMAPKGKTDELIRHGVTDVIIFRNEQKGEVAREISELEKSGFTPDRIHAIPFPWHDVPDFETACGQVVDALKLLDAAYHSPGRSAFVHCTVGEDRTGLLSAVFRLVEQRTQGWTARRAFDEEMCLHGYEAGDPTKPAFVVDAIRRELTPFYLRLAALAETGALGPGRIERSACSRDVEPHYEAAQFACKASPLYLGKAGAPR